jgi:hypothetical protein
MARDSEADLLFAFFLRLLGFGASSDSDTAMTLAARIASGVEIGRGAM